MTSKKGKVSRNKVRQPAPVQEYDNIIDEGVGFLSRFQRFTWDFLGVFLLASALITLIALILPELAGGILITLWRNFIRHAFGYGAVLVVVASSVAGLLMLRMRPYRLDLTGGLQSTSSSKVHWARIIALEMAAFSTLALLSVLGGRLVDRAELGLDGGFIGWGLAELVALILSRIGLTNNIWGGVISGLITLIFLAYGLGLVPVVVKQLQKISASKPTTPLVNDPVISVAPTLAQTGVTIPGLDRKKRRPYVPAEFRKRLNVSGEQAKNIPLPPRDEHLPSLELLVKDQLDRPDERNINQTAGNNLIDMATNLINTIKS